MPIEIEGPDGKVHSFADGTMPDVIDKQMSSLYGGGSLSPFSPQGLPGAGDRTPAAGAVMPSSQSVPPYQTAEDQRNIGLSMLLPRGSVQALQNTPGHAMRMEYAKKVGGDQAALEERQRAGTQVLSMLHQLGETADEGAKTGALDKAIGPTLGSPTVQTWMQRVPVLAGHYEQGYNLNNQLMHDIHGLTTAFIASAGKSGVNMSDARQEAFAETMGAMMRATSKEEFDKIKHDAERIIASTFGLTPGAMPKKPTPPPADAQVYVNPSTGEKIQWNGSQWMKVK